MTNCLLISFIIINLLIVGLVVVCVYFLWRIRGLCKRLVLEMIVVGFNSKEEITFLEETAKERTTKMANPSNAEYFMEGYVKELTIPLKENKIKIDPAPGYIVGDGEKRQIVYMPNDSISQEKSSEFAKTRKLADNEVRCNADIAAHALLQLKLNHVKVRFEFDADCQVINKIIVF